MARGFLPMLTEKNVSDRTGPLLRGTRAAKSRRRVGAIERAAWVVAASFGWAIASGAAPTKPSLQVEPLGPELGRWQLLESENARVTVTAPDAARIRLFYRPLELDERQIALLTVEAPPEEVSVIEWNVGSDLAGDLWAEVEYRDGEKVNTDTIALAREAIVREDPAEVPLDAVGGSVGSDESARSDTLTGGEIERAPLQAGDPRIWITVDVPAFRLTLWQDRKEVATYPIGIGRESFPLPIGPRKASEIVWNPDWIPPDSAWVTSVKRVSPGERIEADDPRNPLGKVKIRLGDAILIHEAVRATDIGRLVSHGCVRMLTQDLYDLTEKIVAARSLEVTAEEIENAKSGTQKLTAKLDPPVWVDIDYDTAVIESGTLHLYPDVYGRGGASLEVLRAELRERGFGDEKLDEQTFREMRKQVSVTEEYVVSLDDLEAGRGLSSGLVEPLTDSPIEPLGP